MLLLIHCPHCHLDTFGLNCPLNCTTGYAVFFGHTSDGGVFIFFSFHCLSYRRIINNTIKIVQGLGYSILWPLDLLRKNVNDKIINLNLNLNIWFGPTINIIRQTKPIPVLCSF